MDFNKNRLDKKSSDVENKENENGDYLGPSVTNFYGKSPLSTSSFNDTWSSSRGNFIPYFDVSRFCLSNKNFICFILIF